MPTVPYDHTITEMLQTAAELIALKPRPERVQWLIFLLQEMQSMQPNAVNDQFLKDLQAAIEQRRTSGEW